MKKPLDSVPVYDGKRFGWGCTTAGAMGCADISDFGKGQMWGQVWNDSCDVGFYIQSHRTGRKVLFTLVREIKTADDGIVAWVYHAYQHERPIMVKIYND